MHPRLYMQSLQYATYDRANEQVTFETRLACGRRHHFYLSKNQFLALNDAILLIDTENAYGHYPLGHGIWMHYNAFDASLYRDTKNCERIYFIFASFSEYKRFTHRRLLSLVRSKEKKTDVPKARATLQARRQYNERDRGRSGRKAEIISTNCKRPLSVAVQSVNRSPTAKRSCWEERNAASRTADNANLSCDDEDSSIFSQWNYSSTRRRSDSISSISSLSKSVSATESVQIFSPTDTFDEMET